MKLAITCNGPGETAGWLRPLLRELYAIEPAAEVHVFYVPDDYATGAEPAYVRELFSQAHVYDVKTYVAAALGRRIAGVPDRVDAVLYLGGDLMHASRLHRKLGGSLMTYRFTRRKYARVTERAFAIDAKNAAELIVAGIASERVTIAGNLAIDGALVEAAAPVEPGAPVDGMLFMPGSRDYEVENMVPFFFTAALAIRRETPDVPIAFGISPFTQLGEVRAAIESGGRPRMFSKRGKLVETSAGTELVSLDGSQRFPVLHNALSAAKRARLAITIPGTKTIELAAIGTPVVACTPLNIPEAVTINGPLTYLNRIPLVGVPLKRAVVTAYSRRFPFHTQPNMDSNREVVRELHGTLTPGRVARVALECFDDAAWLAESAQALRGLYTEHLGAAGRIARGLLEVHQ
ncbi:MAG TPA: hypothetical protein VFO29_11455 [Candidatus Rubrimentiphilum sp.]|nr:hypothetical protein [Candidatus Rubrimentiphilum sp.]